MAAPPGQVIQGPPTNAVFWVRGFHGCGAFCTFSAAEMLYNGAPAESQMPQQMQSVMTLTEYQQAIKDLNAVVKRFTTASYQLLSFAVPVILIFAVAIPVMLAGESACDDNSPKDYWRESCVENWEDCATRDFKALNMLYPDCDMACPSTGNDLCLACPEGCQCIPEDDHRLTSCKIESDSPDKPPKPGCGEYKFVRVCDDVARPLLTVGTVLLYAFLIIGVGCVVFLGCIRNPGVDSELSFGASPNAAPPQS